MRPDICGHLSRRYLTVVQTRGTVDVPPTKVIRDEGGTGTRLPPSVPLPLVPAPGARPVHLADADRVLLVVVAYTGLLRLAVLGVPAPRVVRGPVGEGHQRDPLAVLGGERLVLDVPRHGPGQRAHPCGVLGVGVRVGAEPVAEDGHDLTGLRFHQPIVDRGPVPRGLRGFEARRWRSLPPPPPAGVGW